MSRGINLTFYGLTADQRRTVRNYYHEAQKPVQDLFQLMKERDDIRHEFEIIELSITDHSHPNIDDEEETTWQSLWDAHDKQRRIKHEELERKRIDVERLVGEVKSREEPLKKLAESCAALICPPVAASVHANLPLELRDQIYEYLWEEHINTIDRIISLSYNFYNTEPEEFILQRRDWVLPAPCIADARFIGEDFAREAATLFFRKLTEAEVDYRLVRAYLEMEKFGNMTFHPRDIIRRLTIDIAWSISPREIFAYADLQDSLNSLLTLPIREDFSIIIYLSRDLQFSRDLFCVLDTIKPSYQALVKKGMKIKVLGWQFFTPRWRDPRDIETDIKPKQTCSTAEQLSYYFDRTPEEWLQMKEAEICDIKQPQRKMKCLEIIDTMRRNLLDVDSLKSIEKLYENVACPSV